MSKTAIAIRCDCCERNFQAFINELVCVNQKYEVICPSCNSANEFMNISGFIDFVPQGSIEAVKVN